MIRRRVVVHGHVQGVFFRDSCRQQAQAHRVTGWVTNRADGAVEAVFQGEDPSVASMLTWCRTGPADARVESVDVTEEPVRDERGFAVR